MNFLKKYGIINFHIKNLLYFDNVVRIRLITSAIALFIIQLYIPILTSFKGKYMFIHVNNILIYPATVLAIFGIFKTILEKFIPYLLNNSSFLFIFKIKMVIEGLTMLSMFIFFINKTYFVFVTTFFELILMITVMALSMSFNNYITFFCNKDFANFQNYRMHIVTEVTMLGLLISGILSYINQSLNIILTIILFMFLLIYQIKNLKYLKEKNFLFMLNYHRNKRKKR